MAARKREKTNVTTITDKPSSVATKSDETQEKQLQRESLDRKVASSKSDTILKDDHFVPMPLLVTVLACSGFLAIIGYRDMFGTGKVIFGYMDEAMLLFTKSTKWFEDTKGWKSTQGGFSAIKSVTTDENDMGGFFVRKMTGAAALAFHLQKLIPILFQPASTHWGLKDFNPLLQTSVIGNLCLAGFLTSYMNEFKAGGAEKMAFTIICALLVESFVMSAYIIALLFRRNANISTPAVALPEEKTPKSVISRIVTRTVCLITGLITLIAGRDFFFPGQEMPFPPFDDIYLEWTGAFIHSPPSDSVEAEEYGLEAPLHIGEKIVSRFMALNLLIVSFQKLVSCLLIRVGKDGRGERKAKMFWRAQFIGNAFLLFNLRVFAAPAKSASLDLRWHLMSLAYETFILAVYGYT